jgi:hypothetical protein
MRCEIVSPRCMYAVGIWLAGQTVGQAVDRSSKCKRRANSSLSSASSKRIELS